METCSKHWLNYTVCKLISAIAQQVIGASRRRSWPDLVASHLPNQNHTVFSVHFISLLPRFITKTAPYFCFFLSLVVDLIGMQLGQCRATCDRPDITSRQTQQQKTREICRLRVVVNWTTRVFCGRIAAVEAGSCWQYDPEIRRPTSASRLGSATQVGGMLPAVLRKLGSVPWTEGIEPTRSTVA